MMTEPRAPSYVIIGNGITGVTAAEILRAEDPAATITVVADDPFPVFYRPALKDYLAGRISEDKLPARPTSFYQDRRIRFLADRVVKIQSAQHIIGLQSGRQLGYNRLLLACGASAATLRCPGLDLAGVSTLRSIADYQALLENLKTSRRVVVCGSGTLALETIETLRHRGYPVTHLIRRDTLWSEVLDATASDLVLQQELRDGVDVRLGEEIAEIVGRDSEVIGIVTASGEFIECEVVIIAIGIEPAIDFMKGSGIQCGRGVKVDGGLRTSAGDVYAAGDVVETTNKLTGRTRVIGQWYPSIQQAKIAAYNMLDRLDTTQPFNPNTFYNATNLYGLDFASIGLTRAKGCQELIADPKPRTYRKALLKDGVLVGMLMLGDRSQAMALKRAIDHRVNVEAVSSVLFDPDFKFNAWLDRQGVPPPILGINRSDAGAKKAASSNGRGTSKASKSEDSSSLEAVLVPDATSKTPGLSETRLSRTQVVIVGRQPDVYLFLNEGTVSRRHAEISYADGKYVVRDLGSSNGTFVNDQRLDPAMAHTFRPGDVVQFGPNVKFTFLLRANAQEQMSIGAQTVARMKVPQEVESVSNDSTPSQPVLRADGSLLLPGTADVLPDEVAASFKTSPALVALIDSADKAGKRQPLVFMLKKDQRITIGRGKNNDIDLPDVTVSRRHAELLPGPTSFYVRDLGSSNGVSVNKLKLDSPYLLSHGDLITIGSSAIYYIDLRANRNGAPVSGSQKRDDQLIMPTLTLKTRILTPPESQLGKRKPATTVSKSKANAAKAQKVVAQTASAPLLTLCQTCGTANTRSARFCAGCSALLKR